MIKFSKTFLLGLLFFFFGKENLYAQFGMYLGQEIGVVTGPVAFFSDYGVRYDFETNTGNTGVGIGLVHYFNFAFYADCDCYTTNTYFNDHFRIRSEVDYHRTLLNHYGEIAQKNNPRGEQLRAMNGTAEVFEIGAHLEYYPLSIRDYTAFAYPLSPFFSLGGNYVSYSPDAYSTLGPLEENLFPTFVEGVNLEGGSTWSFVVGIGTRYKLSVVSDLVVNGQWRYYDSDWLDGLNHDNPQNRAKDTIFWLNVGYIYYLNF